MKDKKQVETKITTNEKQAFMGTKPKSLRPMRSMVAVRSLKSRTIATGFVVKTEEKL